MDRITIISLLVIALMLAVMSSARPSVPYAYGKDYAGAEYGGNGFIDYQVPRYGSGYDKYIYGNYEGHAFDIKGDYDYSKILNSYHGGNKGYLQTSYGYGGTYGKY